MGTIGHRDPLVIGGWGGMSLWAPPIPTPILPVWGGGRKTGGNPQFQGQIVVPTPSWSRDPQHFNDME